MYKLSAPPPFPDPCVGVRSCSRFSPPEQMPTTIDCGIKSQSLLASQARFCDA